MNKLKTIIALLILSSCGGPGNDNPPDVNGFYVCGSGCTGVCSFSDSQFVTQTGSTIIVLDDFDSCPGKVDNDGTISLDCDGYSCDGVFAGGVITMECSHDNITCQTVAYVFDPRDQSFGIGGLVFYAEQQGKKD